MRKKQVIFMVMIMMSTLWVMSGDKKGEIEKIKPLSQDRIAILWTSADPDVAKKMIFIYAYNAKKNNWLSTIRLIVWGPSAKLLSQDMELQNWIGKLKEVGVELYACKWCSDSYNVSDLLTKLGIKVIYYGKALTKLIKEDWKILTF